MRNLCFLPLLLLFSSCCFYGDCNEYEDYEYPFEPVYMEREIFENSVVLKEGQPIQKSGKIYIYEDFIFVNDVYKGFHIYNNEDPSNPVLIHFLEVPGATDIAIKNDVVYINQATDLIAVEVDWDLLSVNISKRLVNTFPALQAPDGWSYGAVQEGSVIVDWTAN